MDFITLSKERYSVRKFNEKNLEKYKLDLVLKAGQLAPTAANFQPQRILVINSEVELAKLKECTKYHFNAPVAIHVIGYPADDASPNKMHEQRNAIDNTVFYNNFSGREVKDNDSTARADHN